MGRSYTAPNASRYPSPPSEWPPSSSPAPECPLSSYLRFLLLHEGRNDDNIKGFFGEVYEAYVRIMLNPFHGPATKITNKEFDKKVKLLARRFLS